MPAYPDPSYNPDVYLSLLYPAFELLPSCSRPAWLTHAHFTVVEVLLGADPVIGMPFCVLQSMLGWITAELRDILADLIQSIVVYDCGADSYALY
jgi:hypothetical protein